MERMIGATTRLADEAIQELFNKGEVHIQDHYNKQIAHEYLLDKVLKRLSFEHPRIKIDTNKSKLLITIRK